MAWGYFTEFTLYNPQKTKKSNGFNQINRDYFDIFTKNILDQFYPKYCPHCKEKLTKEIKSIKYAISCPKCHYQGSRLSYTPLHHFKLPIWMFGYILHESIIQHPKVITTTEITKRLCITYKSALLLKRRIQLFTSDQNDKYKKFIHNDIYNTFKNFQLPSKHEDITNLVKDQPIPQTDTVVLFSCSQRANKGRMRYKSTGQTSSIYMSEKLGGKQVGTLVNTFGWKGGPVLYDSIPNLQANTVAPILSKYLPKNAPLFSEMGYIWWVSRNHRMVNHNLKSKHKRYKWSKDRWSQNGVHNQVAEGNNGLLKKAFSQYGWIRPENSQLYLDEFSFFKNLKYYGWNKLVDSQIASHPSSDNVNQEKDGLGIIQRLFHRIFYLQSPQSNRKY